MVNILFLGTSSMMPTAERNLSSILLTYKNERILVDCGEGTQRQLRIAGISPTKITRILITHWHGDHILGLPGLLQTIQASEYQGTLKIYGPVKSKEYFKNMLASYIFKVKMPIEIIEISSSKIVLKEDEFSIEARYLDHSAPCLAYSFKTNDKRKINLDYTKKFGLVQDPIMRKLQEGKSIIYKGKKIDVKKATWLQPGKKIAIVVDTSYNQECIKIAKDADLLICESTYSADFEKEAQEYKHLTSSQAALIASKAKAKQLILTHFSQRFKSTDNLEKEAKKIFKNVKAAKDLASYEV